MKNLQEIRELLIESCYSCEESTNYFYSKLDDENVLQALVLIAGDEEDFGGDAPMAAGDYIPKYPASMLIKYERQFLDILIREYSDVRTEDIAKALAKMQSRKAKPIIEAYISELEYGPRYEKFKEALRFYES